MKVGEDAGGAGLGAGVGVPSQPRHLQLGLWNPATATVPLRQPLTCVAKTEFMLLKKRCTALHFA